MLKVNVEPLVLLHLLWIEGLWDKGLMIVLILLLVHVKLGLLMMMLIVLIVMTLLRDSYDLRLSDLFIAIIFVIKELTVFFTRINDFLDSLVFMKILVNSMIFIIMAIVDLVSSLKSLNQIFIILIMVLLFLWLWVARFAASLAVRLIVLLIVGELVLILFPRMVVTIIVIVTTKLIEPIFVKKVTIWVIKT